jgi:hypothetical protein
LFQPFQPIVTDQPIVTEVVHAQSTYGGTELMAFLEMLDRANVRYERQSHEVFKHPANREFIELDPEGDRPIIRFEFTDGLLDRVYCAI